MFKKIEFAPNTSKTFTKNTSEINNEIHCVVSIEGDNAVLRNLEYFDFYPIADDLYNDLYDHSLENYSGKETPFSVLSSVTHPNNEGNFVVELKSDANAEMTEKLIEFYGVRGYKVIS